MTSKKRVLDVGNCGVDHAAIRRLIEGRFEAEVIQHHSQAEALRALQQESFDLVLVNRKLDRDFSDGIELIHAMQAAPQLAKIPVMLITNYQDHQQKAVQAGATLGFGKAELHDPATLDRIAQVLETSAPAR